MVHLYPQHTVGTETFLAAFHRYAPGLSLCDVVYVVDETGLQCGRGGMLLAKECFAVDDFASNPQEAERSRPAHRLRRPAVCGDGKSKGKLVLAYRDGRRIEVSGGKYAHYLFAVVNCILHLRFGGEPALEA